MGEYRVATSHIGGVDGSLDNINGNLLSDGHKAVVVEASGQVWWYNLDSDSGLGEDSTNFSVITPDNNSLSKRWILVGKTGSVIIPDSTVDQGDNAIVGTLAWHVANAGVNPTTVTILQGTYTVSTSITIASTMTLRFEQGGILADDASNASLTINGSIESGLHQIFDWGTGSGAVTFGGELNPKVHPGWWGFASGVSAANNTTYLTAAIASMAAGQWLIIPPGTHSITNVIFNPPDESGLKAYGELSSSANGVAFTIGDGGTETTYVLRYRVENLKVNSSSTDHTAGRVGVLLHNVYSSYIDIREVRGFETGVKLFGYGTGCVYNEMHFGVLIENKYSLHLDADANGWTNENSFYGGRFTWSSGQDTAGWRHIWIDHYATFNLDNNRFYNPSLESNASTGLDTAVGIYCEGVSAYFYTSRFELDSNNVRGEFTANSADCIIFDGYGFLSVANITDAGTRNKFFARNDIKIAGAVASSSNGVLTLKNLSSESSAPVIAIQGTDGTVNSKFFGDGTIAVGGNLVITSQQAAVANATDAADVITQLNALLARLRTHGLIAT